MTNLKKTLAVVLAFAMMLSMGSAFAYSDVEEGTTVSEAVGILSNLEILTGFEDGTFRPDETVTRAQMAAIICRMLDYEDQAQSSMGTTVFNDVAADHWASGYVNVTQAQGIINGYGDGNFGPEDKVTYEQAVKMIVSALGYDLAAARKGGYPTGYLAIASAEGITKKANGRVGDAAARGTIAVLVYNALEVQLMDQTSWSSDGDDRYAQTDDTVLSKYLGVTKWEGIVSTNSLVGIAAKGYDSTATPQIALKDAVYYEYVNDIYTKNKSTFSAVDCDKVDASALLGKSVIAYVGEDDLTGKDTVYAIVENESKNETLTMSAVQLASDHDKAGEANTIYYKEIGSSKIQDISLDTTGFTAYVNYSEDSSIDSTIEIYNKVKQGGIVEFVSNDADTEYEVVLITSYVDEAVVEDIEEVNGVYAFDFYDDGKYGKIDTEDDDKYYAVYKDGEAATMADIAANDTISYVAVGSKKDFYILYVSSATVTGSVDSYDDENDVVTIAGEDYEVSAASGLDVKKLSGEEGTFFLNVDGQIAYNETVATAVGKYAVIVASYESQSGVDNGTFFQVILADGTLAEYKVNDTAKVYDAEKNTIKDGDNDMTAIKYYASAFTGTSGDAAVAKQADLAGNSKLVAKLTISNDKITKVTLLPSGSASADSDDEYDADAMSIGGIDLDDSSVIFSLSFDKVTGNVEPEKTVIGTASDFLADGEKMVNGASMVAYDEDNGIYGVALGFGLKRTIDPTGAAFIVASKKVTTIDDVDAYIFTGLQNGEEVTITVYDEDEEYTTNPANVKVGDVLLLAAATEDGIVSDIQRLVAVAYDSETGKIDAANTANYNAKADEDDDIFSGYGKAAIVADSKTKFTIAGDIANEYVAENATFGDDVEFAKNTELSYRTSATYTLVDYTENAKKPEVSVESGNKWLLDGYVSYAYVRYVDGKMAEVVVYRISEVTE